MEEFNQSKQSKDISRRIAVGPWSFNDVDAKPNNTFGDTQKQEY